MPAIVTALMGFIVLSNFVAAPTDASTTGTTYAATTTADVALKTTDAGARITPSADGTVLTVSLTSYNAVPGQTDSNPLVTASGAYSNPEVVAARSVDLAGNLPYGTIIALERDATDSNTCHFNRVNYLIGYRVIADSMNARMQNKVDVLFNRDDTVRLQGKEINPSIALGACSGVKIRVVGYIDPRHIPTTQEELAQLVEGKHIAMK